MHITLTAFTGFISLASNTITITLVYLSINYLLFPLLFNETVKLVLPNLYYRL